MQNTGVVGLLLLTAAVAQAEIRCQDKKDAVVVVTGTITGVVAEKKAFGKDGEQLSTHSTSMSPKSKKVMESRKVTRSR